MKHQNGGKPSETVVTDEMEDVTEPIQNEWESNADWGWNNPLKQKVEIDTDNFYPFISRNRSIFPSLILLLPSSSMPQIFGGILYPLSTQWGSSWTLKLLIDFRVCRRIHVILRRGCNEGTRNLQSVFVM